MTYNPSHNQPLNTHHPGLGIASMVCGIVSVLFFWFFLLGIPTSIVAIVFSSIVLKRRKIETNIGTSTSIAGLTTGIIGLLLTGIFFLFFVAIANY